MNDSAKWYGPETGGSGTESIGSGEPAFEIVYSFPTKQEAQAAAQARMKSMSTGSDTFNFTTEASHQLIKSFIEGYIKP